MGIYYVGAIVENFALAPLIPPIIAIGLLFVVFGDILITIVKAFPTIIKMFKNFTDPDLFMRDLTYGIFTGIQLVIWSTMDLIKGIILKIVEKFGFSDDFFGLKTDNREEELEENLQEIKCVKPTFIKYIILVICPPLYVCMNKGLNGYIYIIIDIILTMLFYFPGLLYAILICNICGS